MYCLEHEAKGHLGCVTSASAAFDKITKLQIYDLDHQSDLFSDHLLPFPILTSE